MRLKKLIKKAEENGQRVEHSVGVLIFDKHGNVVNYEEVKGITIIYPKDMDKAVNELLKYTEFEERKKPIYDGYGEWIPFGEIDDNEKVKIRYLRSLGTNYMKTSDYIKRRLKGYIRSIKK